MNEPAPTQQPVPRRRAYNGPECPRCRGYLDLERLPTGETRCPSCNKTFLAALFHPPIVRERVASLSEAGPGGAVPCAIHAGNAAIGNCTRCGVFFCSLCRIRVDGQELCPGCFDRLTAEESLSTARTRIRDYRAMAISISIFGLLASCFGLITGPLVLYLVSQAVRQRRQRLETGGVTGLVVASLLALLQISISLLFLSTFFTTFMQAGSS
ncbi:MAG TPA: hypothetical protein VH394_29735 [Thermoanaerobaculia bacterium]|jgi:hypothetical protein|nr:hypothetical protein [Thermoanaerobaculia bacterium]